MIYRKIEWEWDVEFSSISKEIIEKRIMKKIEETEQEIIDRIWEIEDTMKGEGYQNIIDEPIRIKVRCDKGILYYTLNVGFKADWYYFDWFITAGNCSLIPKDASKEERIEGFLVIQEEKYLKLEAEFEKLKKIFLDLKEKVLEKGGEKK